MSLLNDALRKNTSEAKIKKTGYFDRSHASPPKEKGGQIYRICGLLLLLGGVVIGGWYFLGSLSAQVDSPVVVNRISKPIEIEASNSISKTTGTPKKEVASASDMLKPKGELTLLAEPDKLDAVKKTDPPAKRRLENVSPPPAKKPAKKAEKKPLASAGEPPKQPVERKRPRLTDSQRKAREKAKAVKEKQIKIQSAKEAKGHIHKMIIERRQNLNLAAYETNLFINDIEKITSRKQREIIPFVIEKTGVPKGLKRKDLEKIY